MKRKHWTIQIVADIHTILCATKVRCVVVVNSPFQLDRIDMTQQPKRSNRMSFDHIFSQQLIRFIYDSIHPSISWPYN